MLRFNVNQLDNRYLPLDIFSLTFKHITAMLRSYQSIYVTFYRWMYKNFGQGKLPQFKSLFNVSFLLIVLLTMALLTTQLLLRSGLIRVNAYTDMSVIAGVLFFIFLNHLILLNNRWLKKINLKMARLSRHNPDTWAVVVLIQVIIICGFLLFTIQ